MTDNESQYQALPLAGLLKTLGALPLAVAILAVYAVVLAWATLLERWSGTPAAHSTVYDAAWFAALNVLLGINILCAMAIRFPWNRRQAGFVVTHLGVLVLLLGCLVTRQRGVEAQLPILEGRAAHLAYEELPPSETRTPSVGKHEAAKTTREIDLGFQLYLHKFQRKLDPGTGKPSHYSSLVDFLDRSDPPRKLAENVLITLNAPVDFTDPRSRRTYRLFQSSFSGPWTPGQPEFDELAGGDRSRDQLFLSRLSVNYDPGRWLKQLGSLLIVGGIIMVYYLRVPSSGTDRRLVGERLG
jgi:hypothetical protein